MNLCWVSQNPAGLRANHITCPVVFLSSAFKLGIQELIWGASCIKTEGVNMLQTAHMQDNRVWKTRKRHRIQLEFVLADAQIWFCFLSLSCTDWTVSSLHTFTISSAPYECHVAFISS